MKWATKNDILKQTLVVFLVAKKSVCLDQQTGLSKQPVARELSKTDSDLVI